MKKIDEIEKLSLEELETVSKDVQVPAGLQRRIQDALLATDVAGSRHASSGALPPEAFFSEGDNDDRRRSRKRVMGGSAAALLAVAAAIVAVVLMQKPAYPSDSFDDPALAYAQVEKTFQYISQKMSGGIEVVREAGPKVTKPEEIINKINAK